MALSMTRRNINCRNYARRIKNLTPKEKKERDDRLLTYKLVKLFNKKEFVNYDDLPLPLREDIKPFEEFLYAP